MSTLIEKLNELTKLQHKRAILKYLTEHLDKTFLCPLDTSQKMVLLTEDKLPVPDQVFDEAIQSMIEEINQLDLEINAIMNSSVQ